MAKKNLAKIVAKDKKGKTPNMEGPPGRGGKAGKRRPQKPWTSIYVKPTWYDVGAN